MPDAPGSAHRKHDDGSSARAFTVEQKAAVLRVRKCKPTDFYDILGLEQTRATCSDGEIKKAYRKLSLLTHPDKNGYTGADEAFKMVSRAFQILSDPDKKSKFDKFGGDPDNRFASASSASASGASPFAGFASQRSGAGRRAGGPMFEEEISPEELFRQFFGGGAFGGGGGGPFGGMGMGGPGFAFNLGGGGPGVRIHQFGGNAPRRRPHNHENAPPASVWQALQGLLPLLLLVLIPLLSSLFSATGGGGPAVRVDGPQPPQTLQHVSGNLRVPYWVDPGAVGDYTARKWRALDEVAEGKLVGKLSGECEWELDQRRRLVNEAQGLFWTDQDKMDRARRMEMASCRRLEKYGYRINDRY